MKPVLLAVLLLPVWVCGQTPSKRLVAVTQYVRMAPGNWVPYDSTRIEYDRPSGRTPYDFNYLQYNLHGFEEDPILGSTFFYGPVPVVPATSVRATSYDLQGPLAPRVRVRTAWDRDAAGKPTRLYRQVYRFDTVLYSGATYAFEYDQDRLARVVLQELRDSVWSRSERVLGYDRSRLSWDSTYHFDAQGGLNYTNVRRWAYNDQGRPSLVRLSTNWAQPEPDREFRLTYDAQGRPVYLHQWSNGALLNGDTLTYTGRNPFWTDQIGSGSLFRKHLNAHGLPDTAWWAYRDGRLLHRRTLQYDTDRTILGEEHLSYDVAGNPSGFSALRYYYETVADTADVPVAVSISVLPNPAAEAITVSWRNAPYGTGYRLRVVDLLGRPLFAKRIIWQGVDEAIPVAHLASGIYMVQVLGERNPFAATVTFCKQ